MSYSLNEVEALAKRSARGAGYSWGLAEEAAMATRWLCVHGLNGVSVLADILELGFAPNIDNHTPLDPYADWVAKQELCPIATGAALNDFSWLLTDRELVLHKISNPVFLMPFLALVALKSGRVFALECNGQLAVSDGKQLQIAPQFPSYSDHGKISIASGILGKRDLKNRVEPSAIAWEKLNEFASLTYAPATEESRRLGAGAGNSDND